MAALILAYVFASLTGSLLHVIVLFEYIGAFSVSMSGGRVEACNICCKAVDVLSPNGRR